MRPHCESLESRDCPDGFGVWSPTTGALIGSISIGGIADLRRGNPAAESYLHPPALVAQPYPGLPGDPARVQTALMALSPGEQAWVADAGGRVVVYSAAARLTDLPEFAPFAGVPLADGRTYDMVPAATVYASHTAYVPADLPWAALYESGHVERSLLPDALVTEFDAAVLPAVDYDTAPWPGPADFFRASPREAYAALHWLWEVRSPGQPDVSRAYFDSLAVTLWGA